MLKTQLKFAKFYKPGGNLHVILPCRVDQVIGIFGLAKGRLN